MTNNSAWRWRSDPERFEIEHGEAAPTSEVGDMLTASALASRFPNSPFRQFSTDAVFMLEDIELKASNNSRIIWKESWIRTVMSNSCVGRRKPEQTQPPPVTLPDKPKQPQPPARKFDIE